MTKTPEQWLEEAAPAKKGGTLKLFLGYAPGVGKTYNMLSEAIRRKSRGEDVVIGVVETHGRKGVVELAESSKPFPERRSNIKARFSRRWISMASWPASRPWCWSTSWRTPISKAARIGSVMKMFWNCWMPTSDVLTTMNVQHLESVAPSVQRISGVTVRETVPDWVMKRVKEVVMADLTPEALQTRMRRGDIYPLDRVEKALSNFFRPGNLIALRELALQEVAQEVDRSLETYLDQEGGERKLGSPRKICGSHQFESRGAATDCPRGAHGEATGWRSCTLSMSISEWMTMRPTSVLWPPISALPKRWAPRSCN